MQGFIPDSWWQYTTKWATSLGTLRLSGCGAYGTLPIPYGLAPFPLTDLDLSGNTISGPLELVLGSTTLETVDLSGTYITGDLTTVAWVSLTSLRVLRLSRNTGITGRVTQGGLGATVGWGIA